MLIVRLKIYELIKLGKEEEIMTNIYAFDFDKDNSLQLNSRFNGIASGDRNN